MSELDFDTLISPVSREQFFSEYWETKPLRISKRQPDYYAPLVSGSDIDYLLSAACLLDREGVELLGSRELREALDKKLRPAFIKPFGKGQSFEFAGINRF